MRASRAHWNSSSYIFVGELALLEWMSKAVDTVCSVRVLL